MNLDDQVLGPLAAPPAGAVVALVTATGVDFGVVPGATELAHDSRFELGSVTKTMTAVLLAIAVERGEARLESRVDEFVEVGTNGHLTLLELAQHRTGLPPVPSMWLEKGPADMSDPYRDWTRDDLLEALEHEELGSPAPEYSNFGFMLLGEVLAVAASQPFVSLLHDRVSVPLGLDLTPSHARRPGKVPGYAAGAETSPWTPKLLGAGGFDGDILSLVRYAEANLRPECTELDGALRFVQRGHGDDPLAWQKYGSILWHNGGTGGFASFLAVSAGSRRAVVILTNCEPTTTPIERVGLTLLGVEDPML